MYGATGHTGKLVAAKLKERGIQATLAGRNPEKLKAVSESAGGLPYEAFDLNDKKRLDEVVKQHSAVLHIAGPFTLTGPPVVESCLRNGAHYLDITGETQFIQWVSSKDEEAKAKGIMLMPATGFDVVPGDCLAVYLKDKLPTATHLDLVTFVIRQPDNSGTALPSHGTLLSGALHIIPNGGLIKREGSFAKEGIGRRSRKFSLGDGKDPFDAFSFPAAELACTDKSTKIPNITVYFPGSFSWPFWALGNLGPSIVNFWPIKSTLEFLVHRLPQPDESKSLSTRMWASAEARDVTSGKSVRAAVAVGSGYPFTASACVEIASRVAAGKYTPGFQTPGSAYGANLVREIPGESAQINDLP